MQATPLFLFPGKSAFNKLCSSMFNLLSVLSVEESRNDSDKQIMSYGVDVVIVFNNETFEKSWALN